MSGFLIENGPVDKAAAVPLLVDFSLKLFHLLAMDEQIAPRGRILSPFPADVFFLRRRSLYRLTRLSVSPSNVFALWRIIVLVGYSRGYSTIQFHSFPDYFMSLPAAISDGTGVFESTEVLFTILVSLNTCNPLFFRLIACT